MTKAIFDCGYWKRKLFQIFMAYKSSTTLFIFQFFLSSVQNRASVQRKNEMVRKRERDRKQIKK